MFKYYLPQQKVLTSNKLTQWKTSRTLQIGVFEIQDNENIGNLFSEYELLFLNQTLLVSLFCPFDHKLMQALDIKKPYTKPSQSNIISRYIQIIMPHESNTLPIKKLSLRAASLSNLDNTVTMTLSSIKSILSSLQNGRCSFIFSTLLVHTITTKISTKKSVGLV